MAAISEHRILSEPIQKGAFRGHSVEYPKGLTLLVEAVALVQLVAGRDGGLLVVAPKPDRGEWSTFVGRPEGRYWQIELRLRCRARS